MKSNHLVGFLALALVVAVCVIVYMVVFQDSDSNNATRTGTVATTQNYDYCVIYDACGEDFNFYSSRETAQRDIEEFEPHASDCWEPRWLGCVSRGELTAKMKQNQFSYCSAEIRNTETGEITPIYTGNFEGQSLGDQIYQMSPEEVEQYIEEQKQDGLYDATDELAENEELNIICTQEL